MLTTFLSAMDYHRFIQRGFLLHRHRRERHYSLARKQGVMDENEKMVRAFDWRHATAEEFHEGGGWTHFRAINPPESGK